MSQNYHWKPVAPCEGNPIPSRLIIALVDEYGVLPFTLDEDALLYLRGIRSTFNVLDDNINKAVTNRLIAAIEQHGSIRVMEADK